ncbi:MAG: hypothetical protein LLF76_02625 [Planctomycetaceae bacterium]|nr:hypothetical protein [Planctomycetaceae bacterium]
MIPIKLVLTALAFLPTIGKHRVPYGEYEIPFAVGVSIPPGELADIKAIQLDQLLFEGIRSGTWFNLATVTQTAPITYYNFNEPMGQITPVPEFVLTPHLILATIALARRKTKAAPHA